jgi:hypothetical protein
MGICKGNHFVSCNLIHNKLNHKNVYPHCFLLYSAILSSWKSKDRLILDDLNKVPDDNDYYFLMNTYKVPE